MSTIMIISNKTTNDVANGANRSTQY